MQIGLFDQVTYFVTSFLALAAGILVYARRPKQAEVKAFAALTLSIAGWITTLHFYYLLADSSGVILIGRLNGVFAELVIFFSLVFVYFSFAEKARVPRWLLWFIPLSVAAVAAVTMATDLMVENVCLRGLGRQAESGPLFYSAALYFAAMIAAGAVILANRIRASRGQKRRQVVSFAVAWGVGLAAAAATNLIAPLIAGSQEPCRLGPYTALLFVLLLGYAVVKHELLDVHLLAVEGLVLALLLLFVVNLGLSITPANEAVAAASLAVGTVFGYLLVRKVRTECARTVKAQKLYAELAEAHQHLQEMSMVKNDFISIASHQLRTPVSVLKGYLSMILGNNYGEVSGVLREKMELLYEMNERLVILINNLLNVSRMEKDTVEFECGEVDLVALIRKVVSDVSIKTKEKTVSLVFREPEKPIGAVFLDSEKLVQVLINLIDNAIKYTDQGTIEVSVEDVVESDSVLIRVKDTGVGMAKEDVHHVFEKFFRARQPNGFSQSGMSMGIGLYVCSKFLHSMGGDIWVESTAPGKGTTMAVSLPRRPAAACVAPDPKSNSAPGART